MQKSRRLKKYLPLIVVSVLLVCSLVLSGMLLSEHLRKRRIQEASTESVSDSAVEIFSVYENEHITALAGSATQTAVKTENEVTTETTAAAQQPARKETNLTDATAASDLTDAQETKDPEQTAGLAASQETTDLTDSAAESLSTSTADSAPVYDLAETVRFTALALLKDGASEEDETLQLPFAKLYGHEEPEEEVYEDDDVWYEPEYTEPEYTEPEYTEPEYTEPEYTEPEYTEPEYTEPEYSEPEYTEPEYSEPEYTEPEYSEPEYTEPEESSEEEVVVEESSEEYIEPEEESSEEEEITESSEEQTETEVTTEGETDPENGSEGEPESESEESADDTPSYETNPGITYRDVTEGGRVVDGYTEYEYLAALCQIEAGSSYEGCLAVANVVINRLNYGYASTIYDVIYAPWQFATGSLVSFLESGSVSDAAYNGAADALAGINNVGSFCCFNGTAWLDPATLSTPYVVIGGNCFY